MILKFEKGQRVRHEMGTQEMVINEYQKETQKIKKSMFSDTEFIQTDEYTGKVKCIWLVDNNEKSGYFDQDNLVLFEKL